MSIKIGNNFEYKGSLPLDSRLLFTTLTEMVNFDDNYLYDGIKTFCSETQKWYKYQKSNEVLSDLGKWREDTGGGSSSGSINEAEAIQKEQFKSTYGNIDLNVGIFSQWGTFINDVLSNSSHNWYAPFKGNMVQVTVTTDSTKGNQIKWEYGNAWYVFDTTGTSIIDHIKIKEYSDSAETSATQAGTYATQAGNASIEAESYKEQSQQIYDNISTMILYGTISEYNQLVEEGKIKDNTIFFVVEAG